MENLEQVISCPNCKLGWTREAGRPDDWRQCSVCEARGFLVIDSAKTMERPPLPKPKKALTADKHGDSKMKVDDWIVVRGNFRPELRQIVKLTERMVQAVDDPHRKDSWKRPWQCPRTSVLFCGTEVRARWLLERLISSEALYTEENKAALRRKNERQEKYIADAHLIEATAEAG